MDFVRFVALFSRHSDLPLSLDLETTLAQLCTYEASNKSSIVDFVLPIQYLSPSVTLQWTLIILSPALVVMRDLINRAELAASKYYVQSVLGNNSI